MSATLTIEVPDDLFERLRRESSREGTTPEALAAQYLEDSVAKGSAGRPEADRDPLLKWIGAVDSDVPDAAERHDDYLGRSLSDELRGG